MFSLDLALAAASALTKCWIVSLSFYVVDKALSGELSCTRTGLVIKKKKRKLPSLFLFVDFMHACSGGQILLKPRLSSCFRLKVHKASGESQTGDLLLNTRHVLFCLNRCDL